MSTNNSTNNSIENSSSDVNTTTNNSTDVSDTSTPYEVRVYETFEDMNLREEILHGIYAYGFEKPSPIQASAIVPIINGKDIIASAQTGRKSGWRRRRRSLGPRRGTRLPAIERCQLCAEIAPAPRACCGQDSCELRPVSHSRY